MHYLPSSCAPRMYIQSVHKNGGEGLSQQRKAEPWWYGLCLNKGHPPTWAPPRPWARPRTAVPREAPAPFSGVLALVTQLAHCSSPAAALARRQSCVCAVGCVTATRVPRVPQKARAQTCQAPVFPQHQHPHIFLLVALLSKPAKRKNYVPYPTFPPHQLIWLLNFQQSAAQLNPSLLVTNRHKYSQKVSLVSKKKIFSIINFQKDEDVCSLYKINYNLLPF